MAHYFCHECLVAQTMVTPANPLSFTGTDYQLTHFIKHTLPTAHYNVNSVFDDSTYQAYSGYIVSTTASGYLEVDDQGRENYIWYAGRRAGVQHYSGTFTAPASGIKVVLPEDSGKLHAFPITGNSGHVEKCVSCGREIPLF